MKRIDRLRKSAYDNGHHPNVHIQRDFLLHKAVMTYTDTMTHNVKRACIDSMIMDEYDIEIDPHELLVGRFSTQFTLDESQTILNEQGKTLIQQMGVLSGAATNTTGHRVIDNEKLLRIGIGGIIKEIDQQMDALRYDQAEYTEKMAFYTASKRSLEAVCRFADRHRQALLDLHQNETDPARRAEYLAMADNFKTAPYGPCTHFYEAVQCVWFLQFCLALVDDICLNGRPDNYLIDFYNRDLQDGTITRAQALEIIEALYFKHNEVYNAWPASLLLGGVDRDGNPICNDLTYLFLDAIETTALVNPAVSVSYTKDTPHELLEKGVDLIAKGYTRPAFFNDEVIQRGLLRAGVSAEDARYYVHSTCVEITTIGCSNIMVTMPYINPNKAFEYIFGAGQALFGDECHVAQPIDFSLDDLTDFDAFYRLIKQILVEIIRTHMVQVCQRCLVRERYQSSPLASAFTNDCIARGKDAGAGGAKYNYVYPCFPGFANLVDGIAAVKTAVYDKQVMTLEELGAFCKNNFEDGERMRQFLLNRCDKFGNGQDEVDNIAVELYELIRDELTKYKISLGGTFHPSYFAWEMHGRLGLISSATPDGRKQGQALSECLGCVQGMDKAGPLGVLHSIEKMDQSYGIGGIATNFRFSKDLVSSDEGKQAVIQFIHSFMDSDCFEIQFNVVDQADLIAAKQRPEEYQTLMVRVAGYSDYFVNLTPEVQDEIIRRTEHGSF